MSRFREDSEITRLHRARSVVGVSRSLLAALTLADRAIRVTRGRFDPRVIIDLERLGSVGVPQALSRDRRAGPAGTWRAEDRAGAQAERVVAIDWRSRAVELLAPIDLGGVGKGLALRWARRRAAAHLCDTGFLLEAGGDIATSGSAGDQPWSIGIEDPLGGDRPVAAVVAESEAAIATSSTRRSIWRDPAGRLVHHLIDPRTGEPGGAGLVAVTVAAADPAWAEIWSKALFLEGPDAIGAVARAQGLAAWWVNAAGELSMTPAARQRTAWVRAEAVANRPRSR